MSAQKALMKMTRAVAAILSVRGEAPGVILEGGAEFRRRAVHPTTVYWEAPLAPAMEEVLLKRLEGEQEDLLEFLEAAVDGAKDPGEVHQALVILKVLAEVHDSRQVAMAALIVSYPAELVVPEIEAMLLLKLGVLALVAPIMVGEDCLAVVLPVGALAEARPVSVWERVLVDASV